MHLEVEKYCAKTFIDTFVYRFGDVVGAWIVSFQERPSDLPQPLLSLFLLLLWVLLALFVGRTFAQKKQLKIQ